MGGRAFYLRVTDPSRNRPSRRKRRVRSPHPRIESKRLGGASQCVGAELDEEWGLVGMIAARLRPFYDAQAKERQLSTLKQNSAVQEKIPERNNQQSRDAAGMEWGAWLLASILDVLNLG